MNKHSEKVHQNEWMNTLQDNLFKKKTIETYRIFHSCRLSAFLKKDYFKCMHSPDVAQILKRHLNQNIVRNLKRNPEPFPPPPRLHKKKRPRYDARCHRILWEVLWWKKRRQKLEATTRPASKGASANLEARCSQSESKGNYYQTRHLALVMTPRRQFSPPNCTKTNPASQISTFTSEVIKPGQRSHCLFFIWNVSLLGNRCGLIVALQSLLDGYNEPDLDPILDLTRSPNYTQHPKFLWVFSFFLSVFLF